MTGGETFHSGGHHGGHHGRHRLGAGSWTPLPEPGQHHAHSKAVVGPPGVLITDRSGPIEPAEIVITTVPITGLRSFDLGTVPASVTPPRTWRKAAWFAVASSAGVLIALIAAAAVLVGSPSKWTTIDALPSLPGATDLITTMPSGESTEASATSTVNSSAEAPSTVTPDRIRTDPTTHSTTAPSGSSDATEPSASDPASSGSGSGSATRPTTSPEPERSTRTPLVMSAPPVDADVIGDRTEQYYAAVVDDPGTAYAMTSGPMQSEGPAGIKRRYQDVTSVEVQQIAIDPATARTTNTVRLHHSDGSVSTQRRVLTFSAGDDPRITNETSG